MRSKGTEYYNLKLKGNQCYHSTSAGRDRTAIFIYIFRTMPHSHILADTSEWLPSLYESAAFPCGMPDGNAWQRLEIKRLLEFYVGGTE